MIRYSLTILDTPPSINTNKVRSHWRGFHKAKREWQDAIEKMLMVSSVPRPIPSSGPVQATVLLHFPTKRRRDSENFRPVLSKALGDALVNGGWLVDDTDEDWQLKVAVSRYPVAPGRTDLTLEWSE